MVMPKTTMRPVVSKLYCSPYEATLLIRRRPKVANGGGLVVLDDGGQRVVFTVEGCGTLGKKEELVVKDGGGNALLLIRHTGGVIEALITLTRKWKGFSYEYLKSPKLVFTLNEANSCFPTKSPIRISFEPNGSTACYIRGGFAQGPCAIVGADGGLIAQIGEEMNGDFYYVKIMDGIDQAFVVGVIAVLDYINGGSTRC